MRCFVAIAMPQALREALRERADALRSVGSGLRIPAADTLHLTLRFLGEITAARAEAAADHLAETLAGTGGFDVTLAGAGAFPSARAARVLWMGASDGGSGGLDRCRAAAEAAAIHAGLAADPTPFRPHVTLGRFRVAPGGEALRACFAALEAFAPCAFPAAAVSLWSSELGPSGPRHSKLKDVFL